MPKEAEEVNNEKGAISEDEIRQYKNSDTIRFKDKEEKDSSKFIIQQLQIQLLQLRGQHDATLKTLQDNHEEEMKRVLQKLEEVEKENFNLKQLIKRQREDIPRLDSSYGASAPKVIEMGNSLASYKSDRDPSSYDEAYNDLEVFVENSLDMYKHELALILYPVFVHMYLELVYNTHEHAAKEFIVKFGPRQESYYQEDIKKLSFVTKKDHMKGNKLMENFNTSQFTVRLSRDTYTDLRQQKKHTLLWNVIQEHLYLDVYEGQIESAAGSGEANSQVSKSEAELIPQYDGADDVKVSFCDICNQDFTGSNSVVNKQAHQINLHFKEKFENLIQDRIDDKYVCNYSNCDYKTKRKPDIKRHLGAKHKMLEKFLKEYFVENPPIIPGIGRASAKGSEVVSQEVPAKSKEFGSGTASLLQPRSSSIEPGDLLSAGQFRSKAITLASRIPVSTCVSDLCPPTFTSDSEVRGHFSRREEEEAVASITGENLTGDMGQERKYETIQDEVCNNIPSWQCRVVTDRVCSGVTNQEHKVLPLVFPT